MDGVVELPREVYELLMKIARKRDKNVEELIIDSIAEHLDPKTRIKLYISLHEKYLHTAEEYYAKGDLAQGGEKYWGALVALLNIVGERENLPHYTHRDLREIVEFLVNKTGDSDYSRLFSAAEALHANFYHNFMTKLSFEAHRKDTMKLIKKLRQYLAIT